MSFVSSLLQAIVRLDGEAVVLHVGEKPYIVTPTEQVDLATKGLTIEAATGILNQLLPVDPQNALEEFGAVQYQMPPIPELPGEHFTIVAARGGDDIWIEIRRRQVPDEDRIPLELFAPDPTTPAVARPPAPPAVRSSRATTQVPARSVGGGSPHLATYSREAGRGTSGAVDPGDGDATACTAPCDRRDVDVLAVARRAGARAAVDPQPDSRRRSTADSGPGDVEPGARPASGGCTRRVRAVPVVWRTPGNPHRRGDRDAGGRARARSERRRVAAADADARAQRRGAAHGDRERVDVRHRRPGPRPLHDVSRSCAGQAACSG